MMVTVGLVVAAASAPVEMGTGSTQLNDTHKQTSLQYLSS